MKLFKNSVNAGADFIMTGHGIYNNIDPDTPATLSKKITSDILRDGLGFEGLVISDDLSEMPFFDTGKMELAQAAAAAITAGHNLIVFSHKINETPEIFDKMLEYMQGDPELRAAVENNYRKIISFKQKHYSHFNNKTGR